MPFTIMVAVSDPEQQGWITGLLESAGHTTIQFGGTERLAALEAAPPDLLIAFNSAPHLEGWTLCRLLRSCEHAALNAVPVLLISPDMAGVEAVQITVELGGNGLLPYPIEAGRVLLEVDRLLSRAWSPKPLSRSHRSRARKRRFRGAVPDAGGGSSWLDAVRLRESEAELAAAQRIAHIGSWQWNTLTDEASWSDETFRLFGVTRSALREHRMSFIDLVHPEDRARVNQALSDALSGAVEYDLEYRIKRPDGCERVIHSQAEVLRDEAGKPALMRGTVHDITERKRAEEERARLEEQLQQAQKMESIGRLAGGVAHDFNNLLTVINGYSELVLAQLRAGDPLRATIEEIQVAGERAASLTRQLLAFSRKQVLQPRRLDLNRVVEEMRPMLERLVGEAVEVRVQLGAASGTVHADPHQLEQVIMNLSVNARDAMPKGGRLLIETAGVERDESYVRSHPEDRTGRYVMLAVSDTGTGMDEETRRRIFEPFFTTKGSGQGTGLGLSIVQGIVAQSGGYINVYSRPGNGTTFKIYLPALAEAAAETVKPADVASPAGKETVLVVEDQAEVRNYAVAALRSYGYSVVQAADANEALQVCKGEGGRINLVLTDVVMPNLSGGELAARLKKIRPEIKVLFMSGYTDDAIGHHGTLEEDAQFIQKPFGPQALAEKVRAVLDSPLQQKPEP